MVKILQKQFNPPKNILGKEKIQSMSKYLKRNLQNINALIKNKTF